MASVAVSVANVRFVNSSRSSTGRGSYALWMTYTFVRILGSFSASSRSTRTPTPLPTISR